jgi:pimeloyl-ACP methyl ester carboxylesterase
MNAQEIALTGAHGVRLAAIREGANPEAIVVFAHGFLSDKHALGRFDRLAARYVEAGYSTLRFDFSGNGASGNAPITDERRTGDLRAVLDQVEIWGYQRVALHGHSKGGSVSLRARDPRVSAMVLTGARTAPVYYDWSEHLPADVLTGIRTRGRGRSPATGPRAFHLLTQQSLDDFATIDTREILSAIKLPVLLMYGDAPHDREELLLAEHAACGMRYLSPESRLLIIHGADHSMEGHIEEVADHGIAWLRTYCPA